MITFSIFNSSLIETGKRVLKFIGIGGSVGTANECAPFGVDSNPLKGMTAIHSTTSNNSESIVIGYINKNQLAESGETRFYSLDSNGDLKAFVWLKKDGKLQLNGDAYSAVRFTPLKTGLTNQDTATNAEFTKIAAAISSLGGFYVPTPIVTNIDNSESLDVKLK